MADQGWMVDDGTCDLCVRGQCWQCTKPAETPELDGWIRLLCCCNEGCDLGQRRPDEAVGPYQLWQQAQDEGGSEDERGNRYIELMIEHGHIVDREPGDDSPLFACGYDPRRWRRNSKGGPS